MIGTRTTLYVTLAAGVYAAEYFPVELGAKSIHDVAVVSGNPAEQLDR